MLPQIEKGTFLIVRTDGSEELIRKRPTIQAIETAISAETLDTVAVGRARHDDTVMLVDDAGYEYETIEIAPGHFENRPIRERKPFNDKATAFYHAVCSPGTTHKIVGDVALCRDSDFA